MLAAARGRTLVLAEVADRRRRHHGDHGEDGHDVDGDGIADPSGRACGHDGGHADDLRAALGLRLAAC